ncbi:MAG: hypothetical protein KZQ79_16470, partial [Candidatus Thiodiazotropha sp. (ex Lucinoma borealis)]|nr:hypothetical protein [Candidatus Thiodiazotropha sp. (ex Lucinoma borealis)]
MSGLARFLIAFSLLLLLAACGGGDADAPWDSSVTGSGSNPDVTTAYILGNGAGTNFLPGVLNIGLTSLSSGGQTSVLVSVADADGTLIQDAIDISFSSNCTAQ